MAAHYICFTNCCLIFANSTNSIFPFDTALVEMAKSLAFPEINCNEWCRSHAISSSSLCTSIVVIVSDYFKPSCLCTLQMDVFRHLNWFETSTYLPRLRTIYIIYIFSTRSIEQQTLNNKMFSLDAMR